MSQIKEGIEQEILEEKVVTINRVGKVARGGRKIGFNAVVVVGNKNGKVGYGLGKAPEVAEAIRKGMVVAHKNLVDVPIKDGTIPALITGRCNASRILLKPASRGTGIIAGAPARAVLELAGIENILTKSLGSSNVLNVVKATIDGLRQISKDMERSNLRKSEQ